MKSTERPDFIECVRDLLEDEQVLMMKQFMQHGQISCYAHCLKVAEVSYRAGSLLGWDVRSIARGAMLHDFFLYDWHLKRPEEGLHGFYHPEIALRNARNRFELNEVEADIIVKHMWPLTSAMPRHKEALLVCLVDKGCALTETLSGFQSRFAFVKG